MYFGLKFPYLRSVQLFFNSRTLVFVAHFSHFFDTSLL